MEVFTPLNEDKTKRLKFKKSQVVVLQGNLDLRKRGLKAYIEIRHEKAKETWRRYKVYGTACGLSRCMCDAFIKPYKI